ncbi:MAG: PSD1 and planctomycete cytochrome C domain-containing protein [Planctomycetota bacterium]|nr:PSD1 and planctomycete cytochrome C domain-containing protein [Planctomycetota bacterium]
MFRPLAIAAMALVSAGDASPRPVDYLRDVKPLLRRYCTDCHGARKQRARLRVDTAVALVAGGRSGSTVTPGDGAGSLLVRALRGEGDLERMPYERTPLRAEEIALVRAWIDQGARAPEDETPGVPAKSHWSFAPIGRPAVPKVRDFGWPRNAIDHFVLKRLEDEGLRPSPAADRVTLIRRLSLDLTGLPPSPDEVDTFLADRSTDAGERLVDRLLSSPHYGERWGRHWLDLARYADSHGFTIDGPRSIWKYRDWVIDALNRDLPFDRFTVEQIAGDLLPGATSEQIVATGFHRNTLNNQEGGTDREQFRVEAVADRVNTTGSVFLGLTLGCARCHDHKYDPISQEEYYRFFAFFNSCDEPEIMVPGEAERARLEELGRDLAAARQELAQHDDSAEAVGRLDETRQTLAARVDSLSRRESALRKSIPRTLVMRERPKPRETHVHIRGDFLRPGKRVSPGAPAVLPEVPGQAEGRNRLDLARWLVSPDHPLTPRVTVNRVWQRFLGRGLVATENDFGTRGSRPSHPELLDWLASELVRRRWSLKALHRSIVTSATYRQSSRSRADVDARDPRGELFARQRRVRLEAEVIRDVVLAVSGALTRKIGGPSVFPPQPPGIFRFTQSQRKWSESPGADRFRRGMYTFFWRSSPYPFLTTFDAPNANVCCTRRNLSNTPLQALTLANDRTTWESATALARRLEGDGSSTVEERVRRAFRLCLARSPSPREATLLIDYVESQAREIASDTGDPRVWASLARALFNVDEFITRE